jgi:type II secretory pathway pseudopilin PulG
MSPRRAFTMVETVVGMTLIVLVMVVGINLLPYSLRAMSMGEQKVQAANLAQSLLEEKSTTDFDDLLTTDLPDVDLNGTLYRVHLEVATPKPMLKRVTLRVRWTYRKNLYVVERKTSVCKIPR